MPQEFLAVVRNEITPTGMNPCPTCRLLRGARLWWSNRYPIQFADFVESTISGSMCQAVVRIPNN
ncbi:hypothetical protein M513_03762 [Trichuris suis]|uniref:Uncharacterized protein n=1 Tax=Trichuris suis TaxID=68888 RepID=A0A085MDX6_9BILA|nr:hypothetical protein M513_03762 [Trichuris suis]